MSDLRQLERRLADLDREVRALRAHTADIPARFPRGGGGGIGEYTAETKSALEDAITAGTLIDGSFCRETTDDHCYRVLGGGLVCYTHLEAEEE